MIIEEELARAKLLLSNCAYWAMNALNVQGEPTSRHVNEIREVYLRNILNVSKEFIYHDPGTDSEISFEGDLATYLPLEGWLPPKIERWDA